MCVQVSTCIYMYLCMFVCVSQRVECINHFLDTYILVLSSNYSTIIQASELDLL